MESGFGASKELHVFRHFNSAYKKKIAKKYFKFVIKRVTFSNLCNSSGVTTLIQFGHKTKF